MKLFSKFIEFIKNYSLENFCPRLKEIYENFTEIIISKANHIHWNPDALISIVDKPSKSICSWYPDQNF